MKVNYRYLTREEVNGDVEKPIVIPTSKGDLVLQAITENGDFSDVEIEEVVIDEKN